MYGGIHSVGPTIKIVSLKQMEFIYKYILYFLITVPGTALPIFLLPWAMRTVNNSQEQFKKYLLEEKVRDYFDLIDEYFLQNYIANFNSNLFESNFKQLELTLRKNSLLTLSNKVIYIPFKYRNKKILINK